MYTIRVIIVCFRWLSPFCDLGAISRFFGNGGFDLTDYDRKRRILRLFVMTSLFLIGVGGIGLLLSHLGVGIPCILYKITGLRCPGCGNTRAILSLLQLDIRKALQYNWFFPVEMIYLLWVFAVAAVSYIRGGKFSYHPSRGVLEWVLLIALAGWFVVRNILHI